METQDHEEADLKPICLPSILFFFCSCDLTCSGEPVSLDYIEGIVNLQL